MLRTILSDATFHDKYTILSGQNSTYFIYPSSHPATSMLGSYCLNTEKIALDFAEYFSKLSGRRINSGQSFFATNPAEMKSVTKGLIHRMCTSVPAIPERTPCFLASYEAVHRTPFPTCRRRIHKILDSMQKIWAYTESLSDKIRIFE